MRIKFLGTSHGYASAERYCSCTMIETGGSIYYIDAGAPVYPLTRSFWKVLTGLKENAGFRCFCPKRTESKVCSAF